MRSANFLIALLLGLISVCAGSDITQNTRPSDQLRPRSNPDADRSFGIIRPEPDQSSLNDQASDQDAVCYTMRSYRVERESRHSDVTQPVGYTTCQPAKKFDLRLSIDPALQAPAPE